MRTLSWLLPPVCLALGFLAGRLTSPVGDGPSTTAEAPRALRVGPLTCVNVSAVHEADDNQARLAACQAKLADLTGPKATFVQPWPEDAGAESPEAWTRAMEQVFATCGLGLALEAVDCEEYPCTALLRGAVGEQDEADLSRKLDDCPAWQTWAAGQDHPRSTFQPMDLRCPDGSYQAAWVFLAMDDDGEAMAQVGDDIVSAILTLGRRTNAVARLWRCD